MMPKILEVNSVYIPTILFGALAITSPFWKDVAGDWFAYITLTGLSSWALIKYYAN
jgi:hypothetical protein